MRRVLAALALVSIAGGTGCLGLAAQEAPEKVRYAPRAERPGEPVPGNAGKARIARVRVSSLYERKGFVYRTQDARYQADFYHEFYAPPGSMIRQATGIWLSDSGLFDAVLDATDPSLSDWLIEGYVEQLYIDARTPSRPVTILAVVFNVLDARSRNLDLTFTKRYRREIEAESMVPGHLVSGFSQALIEVLTQFEADLRNSRVGVAREDVRAP